MKKWSVLLLAVLFLMCCFTGCGSGEEPVGEQQEQQKETGVQWMPYGLTFGMTYDEAKAKNSEMPEIAPAKANDGYFSEAQWVAPEFATDYFCVAEEDADTWSLVTTQFHYSFNQSKELYEFYVMVLPETEGRAETVYNDLGRYYSELIGTPSETAEREDALKAVWKKDGISIELMLDATDSSPLVYAILHDENHDLDS